MYQAKGRDCCFYIVRRWKSIIVVALIAALLMCGLDVFKTLRRWNTDKKQCEKDAIAYKEAFDIAEDRVAAYDGQIADDEKEIAILRENPIIDFDRENIGSASVFLQFDATMNEAGEPRQFPSGLMNLYSNALTDITDWDKVGKKGGIDAQYAKMLFSQSVDGSGHTIYLKIFGETQADADAMLKEILKQLNDYTNTFDADTRSSFEISEVNNMSKSGKDEGFSAIQDSVNNRIRDLINDTVNLNNIKEETEYPVEPPTMPTTMDVVKSFIKYFGFGLCAGGFGMIALYYVLFFLNGKINSSEELEFYTDANVMAYDEKKKGKLDRFIAKKETRGLLYAQDDAVIRTVSNIKLSNPDMVKIMFTGIDSEKQVKEIKKSLEKAGNLGLQFGLEKNVLTDKEAYDHLKYYDGVVLVEKLDKSNCVLIKKEIEQIETAGKKVVGNLLVR